MNDLNDIITVLHTRDPLPPLYPSQPWDGALSRRIIESNADAPTRAGLLLWNDDLHASHTISQGIENATGSFWHAIMHRREGDASNSRYWWRRTGAHPAFADVQAAVLDALANAATPDAQAFAAALERAETWLPEEFVACCDKSRGGDDSWQRRVQVAEIAALIEWCQKN